MQAWQFGLLAEQREEEGARHSRKVVHGVVKCGGCWWDRRAHYHCYCGHMMFSIGSHFASAEQRGERIERT